MTERMGTETRKRPPNHLPLAPKAGWVLVFGEHTGGYYRLVRTGVDSSNPDAAEARPKAMETW
ncbi:MAG: hypothetical protein ACYDCQ_11080 [Dehalococcoidia bacterium]